MDSLTALTLKAAVAEKKHTYRNQMMSLHGEGADRPKIELFKIHQPPSPQALKITKKSFVAD